MALLLSVPQQHRSHRAIRKQILETCQGLTVLHTHGNAGLQQCLERLKEQNRTRIKPDKRWQLLEYHQLPIQNIEQKIDQDLSLCRVSVPPLLADAATLMAQIETELAYGYKIVLLQQSYSLHSAAPIEQMLQRALWQLYLSYYRFSQQYQATPEGIWIEIHQIFYSCSTKQQQHRMPHPRDPHQTCSIADTYLQAILTGVFNPYQQLISTTLTVWSFLAQYSGIAKLGPYVETTAHRGKFIIDPTLDLPAKPLSLATPKNNATTTWTLDSKPLIGKLRQLWRHPDDSKTDHLVLDRLFVSRALRAWDLAPCRSSKRLGHESACRVVIGLSACHQQINHQALLIPDQLLQRTVSDKRTTIGSRYQFIRQQLSHEESSAASTIADWHTINESPTGFCFFGSATIESKLDLGTILALDIQDGTWHIGIVRWVRKQEQQNFQLGVENLGPGITPVAVMPIAAHRVTDIVPALLVPQNPLLQRSMGLLTQSGLYSKGQSVLIDDGYRLYRFHCLKRLEQQRYFDWWTLRPAEESPHQDHS